MRIVFCKYGTNDEERLVSMAAPMDRLRQIIAETKPSLFTCSHCNIHYALLPCGSTKLEDRLESEMKMGMTMCCGNLKKNRKNIYIYHN